MKKLVATLVVFVLVCSMVACKGSSDDVQSGTEQNPGTQTDAGADDPGQTSSQGTEPGTDVPAQQDQGNTSANTFRFSIFCDGQEESCTYDDLEGTIADWAISEYNRSGWVLSGSDLVSANGLYRIAEMGGWSFSEIVSAYGGKIWAESTYENLNIPDTDEQGVFYVHTDTAIYEYYFEDDSITLLNWFDTGFNMTDWFYSEADDAALSDYVSGWQIPGRYVHMTMKEILKNGGYIYTEACGEWDDNFDDDWDD